MRINQWPQQERPREKLLQHGAQKLSDAELLAIFLRTGRKGKTAVDLARECLVHCGGLSELLNKPWQDCRHIAGIGPAKYALLQAASEMGRRSQTKTPFCPRIQSAKDALGQLRPHLHQQPKEIFVGLFLNSKNQLIVTKVLAEGSLNHITLYPREVIRLALHHNASALIIAHNHPSGDPTPSQEDIALTEQLRTILTQVDIRLLDHIIYGRNCYYTLLEKHMVQL